MTLAKKACKDYRIPLLAVLIFVIMSLVNKNFFTPYNIFTIADSISGYGIVALGFTFILLVGQLDISFGSVIALSACIFMMMLQAEMNFLLALLAAIAVGLVNFFLTRMRDAEEKSAKTTVRAIGGALADSGKSAVDSLEAGAKGAITVAVACAMAGIIAGCITVTGLASILINAIVQLAGNATFIGLILTMVCCIILGMGVPTTANYCIMASTCAPILIKMGYPLVAAHFFVFYFGIVADITPPVALAAYAGSAIAKSDPMKTGINATKLAIAAFIVPYIFAMNPSMLLMDQGVLAAIQVIITSCLGIFGIAAALEGYIVTRAPWWQRILLAAGGLCLIDPEFMTDVVGVAVIVVVIVLQIVLRKHSKPAAA